jgi:hypothetical protein
MRTLALALAIALPSAAGAGVEPPPRYRQTLDLAAGFGDSRYSGAISWNHLYEWVPRVSAGLGARFATFRGAGSNRYTTAPKELIDAGRVHDLDVDGPLTYSLNLQIIGTLRLVGGLELGADIDLVGFAFGPDRDAISRSPTPAFAGPLRAHVATFDAFLFGARDRGQLDSELFLAWWASDRIALRLGVSHFVTEYRTERSLDDGNDRFRQSRTLPFVAFAWRLR